MCTFCVRAAVLAACITGCRSTVHRPYLDALVDDPTDRMIVDGMKTSHVPGLSVCVVDKTGVIWSKGYGWANIEKRIPMTPDSVQNIASISKTIVATAIMQLWEQGKFKLTDDINGYLPFRVRSPWHPDESITFLHLLTHTAAIADGLAYAQSYACGDPTVSLADWIHGYVTPGGTYYGLFNFHWHKPGDKHSYSNVGFGILGLLVEQISGEALNEYCKENIFLPLGMNETSWFLADIEPDRHAALYESAANWLTRPDFSGGRGGPLVNAGSETFMPYCLYSFTNYPDGTVRTSVNQLGRYLTAYINRGEYEGEQVLKAETVDRMLTVQLSRMQDTSRRQGLAWAEIRSAVSAQDARWGHSGSDPGVSSLMVFDRELGLGVILLQNGGGGQLKMDVVNHLFHKHTVAGTTP